VIGLLINVIVKFVDSCMLFFICQFYQWQMFKCFVPRCIIDHFSWNYSWFFTRYDNVYCMLVINL